MSEPKKKIALGLVLLAVIFFVGSFLVAVDKVSALDTSGPSFTPMSDPYTPPSAPVGDFTLDANPVAGSGLGQNIGAPVPPAPGVLATITGNIYDAIKTALQEIAKIMEEEATKALRYALVSSADMMSRQFGYQLAMKIVEDNDPLRDSRGWDQIFQDTLDSAAGEFIGSFSQAFFGEASLLCSPNPYVRLQILISLFQSERPTPKCNWREVEQNWKNLRDESAADRLKRLQASFEPMQSDAGAMLFALDKLEQVKGKAKTVNFDPLKVDFGGRWLDKTNIGNYVTQSRKDLEFFVNQSFGEVPENRANSAYLASLTVGSVLAPFTSSFTQTLTSEMMKLWLRDLWGLKDPCDIKDASGESSLCGLTLADLPGGEAGGYAGSYLAGGTDAAKETLANLLMPKIKLGGEYDIIFEFTACPTEYPALNNCTITQSFANAVTSQMTLADAVAGGQYINDALPFGYTNPATGDEPLTPDAGFSKTNIQKLRKARIVPAGWEIAVQVAREQAQTQPITLRRLMAEFSQSGTDHICNGFKNDGSLVDPADSPYCGLVDPNWVLKAPQQKCVSLTNGPLQVTAGQRQEYCADSQDCILESQDGGCQAWGHCTREKNTWWLDGDTCPSQDASCQTFTNTETGVKVTYLKNSLLYSACDAQNTGCRWYSTTRNPAGEWQSTPKLYLDSSAETCSSGAVGCSQLIQSYAGSGTNLLPNGGFENYFKDDIGKVYFSSWGYQNNAAAVISTDDSSLLSQTAISLPNNVNLTPDLDSVDHNQIDSGYALAERTFSLSFATKGCQEDTGIAFGNLTKNLSDLTAGNSNWSVDAWNTYYLTYTYPAGTAERNIIFNLGIKTASRCLLDNIKIEEGFLASAYSEYSNNLSVYLRKPPAYLNCRGRNDDPAECDNYATVCSAEDVGCQEYKAVSDGTIVPGVVRPEDYCPAGCSGYSTYKQVASRFRLEQFPLYFIPSTAKTCDYANSGCEEFTNLDKLAAGGEAKENYSFLRRCQKPAPASSDCQAFYTWEGSATVGYQLKLYQLKGQTDSQGQAAPLVVKNFTFIDDRGHEASGWDCKMFYGKNMGEAGYSQQLTPDCKEFYSAAGYISYRLYS
ncbi:MAG: hypothetical protein WCT37_05045, partial [Patescibacteria group bacterium]